MVAVKSPRGRKRSRPSAVAGDKGYSYPRVRAWLRRHGIRAVIPMRSNQRARGYRTARAFDREAYRDRNVVERCVGWLKEPRRIVTRFEKLAVNFLAMVKIAMIERLFRIGLSDRA